MKAKDFALVGVYTALLIGGQLALSFVAGIEIVTVLLLSFAFHFGLRRSILVANAFCILRCFIFGFFPTVMLLYFIYYNLFVIIFSVIGKRCSGKLSVIKAIIIICTAALCTACFSLLDDVITPLFYSFDWTTTKAYFIASLYTMVTQIICTVITVTLLFPPINALFCHTFKLKQKRGLNSQK